MSPARFGRLPHGSVVLGNRGAGRCLAPQLEATAPVEVPVASEDDCRHGNTGNDKAGDRGDWHRLVLVVRGCLTVAPHAPVPVVFTLARGEQSNPLWGQRQSRGNQRATAAAALKAMTPGGGGER